MLELKSYTLLLNDICILLVFLDQTKINICGYFQSTMKVYTVPGVFTNTCPSQEYHFPFQTTLNFNSGRIRIIINYLYVSHFPVCPSKGEKLCVYNWNDQITKASALAKPWCLCLPFVIWSELVSKQMFLLASGTLQVTGAAVAMTSDEGTDCDDNVICRSIHIKCLRV